MPLGGVIVAVVEQAGVTLVKWPDHSRTPPSVIWNHTKIGACGE
jgi:hypothetical protein